MTTESNPMTLEKAKSKFALSGHLIQVATDPALNHEMELEAIRAVEARGFISGHASLSAEIERLKSHGEYFDRHIDASEALATQDKYPQDKLSSFHPGDYIEWLRAELSSEREAVKALVAAAEILLKASADTIGACVSNLSFHLTAYQTRQKEHGEGKGS